MVESKIQESTIEVMAKNFFKEASQYGFRYKEILKFVNTLLDLSLDKSFSGVRKENKTDTQIYRNIDGCREMPLNSGTVVIRPFNKKKDSAALSEWVQDSNGRFFLISSSCGSFISLESLIEGEHNHIGIIENKEKKRIGALAFLNFDPLQGKAELRKIIGDPESRGLGMGKEATKMWIKYGFAGLGLRKIYLSTIETNLGNIKINEELGFKVEGLLRKEILVDGEFNDILRMGLCRE